MMLQKAFNYTQEKTYSGIAKAIWNSKFEVFVDVIQFLYSVGTCCGYAIIIANELYLRALRYTSIVAISGILYITIVVGGVRLLPRRCCTARCTRTRADWRSLRSSRAIWAAV